jgi:pentatricopeptide repeat protein
MIRNILSNRKIFFNNTSPLWRRHSSSITPINRFYSNLNLNQQQEFNNDDLWRRRVRTSNSIQNCLNTSQKLLEIGNNNHSNNYSFVTNAILNRIRNNRKKIEFEEYSVIVEFASTHNLFKLAKQLLLCSITQLQSEDESIVLQNHIIERLIIPSQSEVDPIEHIFPSLQLLLQSKQEERAIQLIDLLFVLKSKPDSIHYSKLIESAIKSDLITIAKQLLRKALKSKITFAPTQLEYMMCNLANASQMEFAITIFHELVHYKVNIDVPVYIVLLDKLKRKNLEYCELVLQHLSTQPVTNTRLFRSIFNVIGAMRDIELGNLWLKRLLNSKIQFTMNSVDGLLHAYSKRKKISEALALFSYIEKVAGVSPTIFSFVILMNGCTSMEQIQSILDAMKKRKITHDTVSLNVLIKYHIRYGSVEEAFKIYEKMKDMWFMDNIEQVKPDAVTISTLLNSGHGQESSVADSLFNDFKQLNLKMEALLKYRLIQISPEYRNTMYETVMQSSISSLHITNNQFSECYAILLAALRHQRQYEQFHALIKKLSSARISVEPIVPQKYQIA